MEDPADELVRQNLHLVQYAAERQHAKLPPCVEIGDLIPAKFNREGVGVSVVRAWGFNVVS